RYARGGTCGEQGEGQEQECGVWHPLPSPPLLRGRGSLNPPLPRSGGGLGRGVCQRHAGYRRSGNSDCKPAALASHRPRSVIRPVTSRAGVTSNAGLAAGLSVGTTRTVATVPSAMRPVISVTSAGERCSIGISAIPSDTIQSMVLDGSATQNG